MPVQFILGRSGTGKTTRCIEAVVEALSDADRGGPLVLLVPEQATYQAERAVLSSPRVAGYHRLNVLSFDRLEFLLLQRGYVRRSLSRIGQQMIVHRILRQSAGELGIFGASAGSAGLGRRMTQAITELHEYGKTPADVDRLLEAFQKRLAGSTALKFADIALVLRRYLEFIEGRMVNPDVQLEAVRKAVGKSPIIAGARVWVDGFSGFTAAESAILLEIFKAAGDCFVTVCLDAGRRGGDDGLFACTERMYAGLVEMIRNNGIPMAEPLALTEPARFLRCPQLAHVERNVSRHEAPKLKAQGAVRIVAAPDVRSEVEFVARQISGLVRQTDTRYGDIAVIAPDLGRYEHYVRAYFDDYCIPHFIDKQQSLVHHPLVRLLCSALRAVTEGFGSGDVFCCLKTDLLPLERDEVDLLENYCLAFGVDGADWLGEKPWAFAGPRDSRFDERQIDAIRRRAAADLRRLRDALDTGGRSISARRFAKAVRGFLESLDVRGRLGRWPQVGRRDTEHVQIYGRVIDVLEEMAEIFDGSEMPCGDYVGVLDAALAQLKLAFIPQTLDQVTVGTIERSRHGELEAVFLMGATQRQFPCPVESPALLTDCDREAAEAADFALAEPTAARLLRRRYLSYIAFTRSRRRLCVSYPLSDERQRPIARSQFVDGLQSLFEDLDEERPSGGPAGLRDVQTAGELVDVLCRGLGGDGPPRPCGGGVVTRRLAESMRDVPALAGPAESAIWAADYDNSAALDGDTARLISAGKTSGSVTELCAFAACPYRHFAMYTLGLRKRKEFELEPLDLGLFYHEVLHDLFADMNRRGISLSGGGGIVGLLRESVARCCRRSPFLSNFISRSGYNAFMVDSAARTLEGCVSALAELAAAGGLRPFATEVWFGPAGGRECRLGGVDVDLGGGRRFHLVGKIDRIDAAEAGGRPVAVVFDYKRTARSFDWSGFYQGLDLQLGAYMLALKDAAGRGEAAEPIGAFYLPVERPFKKAQAGSKRSEDEFAYKARGIFDGSFFGLLDGKAAGGWSRYYNFRVLKNNDQYGNYHVSGALRPRHFEKVLDFTRRKIASLAAAILEGNIAVKPYRLGTLKPCVYCDYTAVCRFDPLINRSNVIRTMSKPEVLEAMDNG
jgi:ATP-dependent helicase/nuclease subunit B